MKGDLLVKPTPIAARNRAAYDRSDAVAEYLARRDLTDCEISLFETHIHPGMKVLDLGVGTGRTTEVLLSLTAGDYVGIDYSPHMVRACRERFPDANIRAMDASDLSTFADNSFDAVVFSFNGLDCLHPYSQRIRCIREMRRILSTTGVAIISSHHARAFLRLPPRSLLDQGLFWRARAVQLYSTIRLLRCALQSLAFWRGHGYMRDTTSPQTLYAATPGRVVKEFEVEGFSFIEILPTTYPLKLPPRYTSFYYYVFKNVKAKG